MSALEWLSLAIGVAIIVIVLFDLFASVLVPRPIPGRLLLSAYLRRYTWKWWSAIFFSVQPPDRREIILGFYAPLSVVAVLAVWLIGLIFGYGFILYGLKEQTHPVLANIWEASYFAGTCILTIGFGDIVPTGPAARVISIAAGATGLATVAVVLAFLFSLFNSYREREVFEVTLDARAGAPPSGVALLETHAQLDLVDDLPRFFETAQDWCAYVLETHLAYPVLCYFRSTHVGMSWIAALGAVLDAASLVIATVEGVPKGQAQLVHSVGSHVVYDVAHYFRLLGPEQTLVEYNEYITARERLAAAGYNLIDETQSWQTFTRLRGEYAGSLNNLARLWTITPTQWIGDRSPLEARRD
jgi:Ion channel